MVSIIQDVGIAAGRWVDPFLPKDRKGKKQEENLKIQVDLKDTPTK